jgi:hypothetical protein
MQQLLSQQQQQQRGSFSSPLPPTLDADLLHVQRQLAGTSLTHDSSTYAPPASNLAAGSSSSSSAGRLPLAAAAAAAAVPGGMFSNSEPLPGPLDAAPAGSPSCYALDGEIFRLLKVRPGRGFEIEVVTDPPQQKGSQIARDLSNIEDCCFAACAAERRFMECCFNGDRLINAGMCLSVVGSLNGTLLQPKQLYQSVHVADSACM